MIYSKNNIFHDIKLSGDYLKNCKFADDDIFYHHHKNNVKIYDCLDKDHWEHLRKNSNVKLLHVNNAETFGQGFAFAIKKTIQEHHINPEQIYVIVYDVLHKTFLENQLKQLNVIGINIGVFDLLFARTIVPAESVYPIKKFSVLSRNYKLWRLRLYTELVRNDLIDNFIYSFYNTNPYTKTLFDLVEMTTELQQLTTVDQKISDWMLKIPYTINDNADNIWTNTSYEAILASDFHLVVETHFENKPSVSFLTEKTYKALACSKPFLMFGTVGFLSGLREIGYKTFSPFIDESYDKIVNNEQRLSTLVNEIKRINNLPASEYKILLANCNAIAAENFKIFQEKKIASVNQSNFNYAFDFLKPHLHKHDGWDYPIVIL